MRTASLVFCICLLYSCDKDDSCCELTEQSIVADWLLVETGASNGADYVVTQVAASPEQHIRIYDDGTMSSTVKGLKDFRYYYLSTDATSDGPVIAFFKSDPGPSPTTFDERYSISVDSKKLKLSFRRCVEGCHLGFEKMDR